MTSKGFVAIFRRAEVFRLEQQGLSNAIAPERAG